MPNNLYLLRRGLTLSEQGIDPCCAHSDMLAAQGALEVLKKTMDLACRNLGQVIHAKDPASWQTAALLAGANASGVVHLHSLESSVAGKAENLAGYPATKAACPDDLGTEISSERLREVLATAGGRPVVIVAPLPELRLLYSQITGKSGHSLPVLAPGSAIGLEVETENVGAADEPDLC